MIFLNSHKNLMLPIDNDFKLITKPLSQLQKLTVLYVEDSDRRGLTLSRSLTPTL